MGLTDQVNENPADNAIDALVGEGKKYKDANELARAYTNANMHINELRDDLDGMRRNDGLLNEVLEEVKRQPSERAEPDDNAASAAPSMTKEEVANIARAAINETTVQQTAEQNMQRSLTMLDQHYGGRDGTANALKELSSDPQTKDLIDSMANTNPELLYRTVTGAQEAPKHTPSNTPGVQVSASSRPPATNVDISWSEAQRLRKGDVKERAVYNSVEFRQRMERSSADAEAKGIDYFAT